MKDPEIPKPVATDGVTPPVRSACKYYVETLGTRALLDESKQR